MATDGIRTVFDMKSMALNDNETNTYPRGSRRWGDLKKIKKKYWSWKM